MDDDARRKLVSTEQSLSMEPEPRLPSGMEGLENFSLSDPRDDEDDKPEPDYVDAESFFNLPGDTDDDEDEDEKGK